MRVTIIPIVIGPFVSVTKGLVQKLEHLEIRNNELIFEKRQLIIDYIIYLSIYLFIYYHYYYYYWISMARPEMECQSTGQLANILLIRSMARLRSWFTYTKDSYQRLKNGTWYVLA